MTRNLVIVESPAKAKTIKKYLGKDFEVMASYGHVRDLVPKEGAVDPTRNFEMRWELIDKNRKHVDAICTRVAQGRCALPLDRPRPRRRGDLVAPLSAAEDSVRSTARACIAACFTRSRRTPCRKRSTSRARSPMSSSRRTSRVARSTTWSASTSRRCSGRKAGLSGASAGRVQSPALRMICEREEEILAFKPREYWTIDAQAEQGSPSSPRSSRSSRREGRAVHDHDGAEAEKARAQIEQAARGTLVVTNVEKSSASATGGAVHHLDAAAGSRAQARLWGAAHDAHRAALYEGVDFGEGPIGLITYMRTDSVNLAVEAVREIRGVIARSTARRHCPMPRACTAPSRRTRRKRTKPCARRPRRARRSSSPARSTRTSTSCTR
jgi:DNA topoisomerase-1